MTTSQAATRTVELRDRAEAVIPGGVSSNVRLLAPRVFFERGAGPRLWDVEGNDYVDYLLGQGPAFLGHAHPRVTEAVAQAVRSGMVYGAQHVLEVEAAERFIAAVRWPDLVRFGVSGTESVQGALRLARAATGRRRLLRFAGHYHGWVDNVLMDFGAEGGGPASLGQPADALADWLVAPFNDTEALAEVFSAHGEEIAAVIVEPMMCNQGAIVAERDFLEALRALATAHGTVLIFDEVITGFRLALGGAAEHYGVTPDLAVYGKALAGGWPVSALAGREELMGRFGTGEVNHSGTFNASVMAAAAVVATLEVLTEDPPYERVADHGTRLRAGLAELGDKHQVPLRIQGLPAAFHVSFGGPRSAGGSAPVRDLSGLRELDLVRYADFSRLLAEHGVWVAGRGIWYVSAAHGDAELSDALDRVDAALAADSGTA
ncbi:aspartate aminotransferase family protein [Catenulispora pinisilvae]|uniref:aspartate aminotransferase family protein n=1 Tax=Catenulispora pinisilvae TaxID=2705253 RepID=UPI001891FBE0|nr:aspartate aminotransferase family protein [Catenulispora pinisilvae]